MRVPSADPHAGIVGQTTCVVLGDMYVAECGLLAFEAVMAADVW
jgi:hypothetical protein